MDTIVPCLGAFGFQVWFTREVIPVVQDRRVSHEKGALALNFQAS